MNRVRVAKLHASKNTLRQFIVGLSLNYKSKSHQDFFEVRVFHEANSLFGKIGKGVQRNVELQTREFRVLVDKACDPRSLDEKWLSIIAGNPPRHPNFFQIMRVWNDFEPRKPAWVAGCSSAPFFEKTDSIYFRFAWIVGIFLGRIVPVGGYPFQNLSCFLSHGEIKRHGITPSITARPTKLWWICWKGDTDYKYIRSSPCFGAVILKV